MAAGRRRDGRPLKSCDADSSCDVAVTDVAAVVAAAAAAAVVVVAAVADVDALLPSWSFAVD